MKFGYIFLYVKDVHKTVEFYEAAFGLKRGDVMNSGEFGEVQSGETVLSFLQLEAARKSMPLDFMPASLEGKAPPMKLGLQFDTQDEVIEIFERAVKAGAWATEKPSAKFWGHFSAFVRDIDGFAIEIYSVLKP